MSSCCESDPMTDRTAVPELDTVLMRVGAAASERDAEYGAGLGLEVAWLHEAGMLVGAMTKALSGRCGWSDDPLAVAGVLRGVGRSSLPLGRLYEGHLNAAQLVGLYAQPSLQARCAATVGRGGLLGVWGADGAAPVQAGRTPQGFRLQGAKIFCSGLGVVTVAIVSATLDGETRLFAVDVGDDDRADAADWAVSGMRATCSGGYDFEGIDLPADALMGAAGAYFVEPYFLGGMYRICAVQAGGLEALLNALVSSLRHRPRASEFLSQLRVGGVASRVSTAIAVTERVARALRDGLDPSAIAREAVLGREAVERCVVEALEIVERAVGTEAHREATAISLIRRDLSFYIRQAALDERLAGVGRGYLEHN